MAFCVLAFSLFLLGSSFMCLHPTWHQRLFKRRYFCNRCLDVIAKEEAADEGRYEDRP
jgi:hypothetical protein